MNSDTYMEAPRLASRLTALEDALLLALVFALDDDAKARLILAFADLQRSAAESSESLLAKARADLFEKFAMALDGKGHEYLERLERQPE